MAVAPLLRDAATKRKESEIVRAILDYLAICPGVISWRNNVGAVSEEHKGKRRFVRFGVKGLPDIIGSVPWCFLHGRTNCLHSEAIGPRPFGLEVKRPDRPLTPTQSVMATALANAGWLIRRVESVADVRAALGR